MRVHVGTNRAAQLPVAARHHRAARRHRLRVPEHRMVQVRLGSFGVLQRNRPLDAQVRVGEVHERVRLLLFQRPVRVHEVRVHGTVLQRLKAVAHAARHVDRLRRIQHGRIHLAEALAWTQVHPRAKHAAGRDADVLVPRLRVDATRHALLRVVADVVLHRPEIRQAQARLLRTLPVLLEPAAVVAMHRQVEHHQTRNVRLHGPQIFFEIHVIHPLTGPAACNALQSRPWPVPTTHGSACTIRSSALGPIRSRCASASSRAWCAAWSSRSRNDGRGPDGP